MYFMPNRSQWLLSRLLVPIAGVWGYIVLIIQRGCCKLRFPQEYFSLWLYVGLTGLGLVGFGDIFISFPKDPSGS